ncbi:NACHT domain-containing protein [Methylorubrum extorquens]|uniref:NACHT domain-containing protein n=1 Tax=Methylorubrum extorquens TaxID=408 RepID=UPI0022375E30|nr:hypothetical protein [Methylorubrum extorquens]UYW32641.1 hypothetical protein OKB92_00485 [Methylorubrum extorquens]
MAAKLAGSELRDSIARVLRLKYQVVETEYRLDCTTADVFYVDDTNPTFPRPIAIEAKDWSSALTSRDIAEIEVLYRPSLSSREIEFLWIISNHPLASSPADTIKKLKGVKYSTVEEFHSSMMNFSGVLQDNILEYQRSDSFTNFIPTRVADSDKYLFDYVGEWLQQSGNGLIVYGGYGLGKTTFSMYLAYHLSVRHNEGLFKRIPIRILLGRMFTKQDISGLICATLSGADGKPSVRDFTYNLFLEANALGSYLLILDGFDEMKHAMTIEDFTYTFEQMKPLFKGNAKVVLLGRPDSFITYGEEYRVLSSLFENPRTSGSSLTKVEIGFFSEPEIRSYLKNFARDRNELAHGGRAVKFDQLVDKLLKEGDVLSRPVQLKMFTEIVDLAIDDDLDINRYELYRQFIFKFILRESRKEARQIPHPDGVPAEFSDDRAQFMMSMAWWVLAVKKENRFFAEEIPISMIPRSLKLRRDDSTASREAIVGSVIEPMDKSHVIDKKAKRIYFFPHKSYLEFLFAQYFVNIELEREDFAIFYDILNPEILSFIAEGPQAGPRKLRAGLLYVLAPVDIDIINVCLLDREIAGEISSSKKYSTSSHTYIHYLFIARQASCDTESFLIRKFGESRSVDAGVAAMNCICAHLAVGGSKSFVSLVIGSLISAVSPIMLKRLWDLSESVDYFNVDVSSLSAAVIRQCIAFSPDRKKMQINLERFYSLVRYAARNSLYVDIVKLSSGRRSVSVNTSDVSKTLNSNTRPIFDTMVRNIINADPFARIHMRGEAEKRFGYM